MSLWLKLMFALVYNISGNISSIHCLSSRHKWDFFLHFQNCVPIRWHNKGGVLCIQVIAMRNQFWNWHNLAYIDIFQWHSPSETDTSNWSCYKGNNQGNTWSRPYKMHKTWKNNYFLDFLLTYTWNLVCIPNILIWIHHQYNIHEFREKIYWWFFQ